MHKRVIHDEQGHAHFVTFSCYKRRNMLSLQETKRIVVGTLGAQITKHKTKLVGFVIMPNHVHVLVWFGDGGRISPFMRDWKRETSYKIKKFLRNSEYARRHDLREPVWQPRYHDFNVVSREKILEKLNYMHNNPVAANLADTPCEYRFSSALWYEKGQSVGVRIECM